MTTIDVLDRRARSLVGASIAPGERVLFCLVGERGQALVSLESRLLVVKAGLAIGLTSARLQGFEYSDIVEIRLAVGTVYTAVEVHPSSYRATAREWWQARSPDEDPLRATSCIVIPTARVPEYEPYIEALRQLVAEARQRATPDDEERASGRAEAVGHAAESLVSQLERLAALHASGSLSDEEFEGAKRKLLG